MPSSSKAASFISLPILSSLPVVIVVQGVAGGQWEFPLTLVAIEPQVDDVIDIDATRLGETAAVGFRLTSTTRWVHSSVFLVGVSVLLMSSDGTRNDWNKITFYPCDRSVLNL